MATSTSTDLIVPGDDSPVAVLRMSASELKELVSENLGSDKLGAGDIKRVKIPGAGATSWEINTLRGDESVKELDGIILRITEQRGYWADEYSGANDPPDCQSKDMVTGIPSEDSGLPGGSCDACPLNQWGSSPKGEGKACKETRQIFLLRPGSILPLVINVPPTSLRPLKQYRLSVFDAGLKLTGVVTRLSLEKVQPEGVPAYAKLVLRAGDFLDDDAHARIKAYADMLMPSMDRAAAEPHIDDDDAEPMAAAA